MKTLTDQIVAARQAAAEIHDTAKAEDRPLTDAERAEFDRLVAEASDLKARHEQAVADRDALRDLEQIAEPTQAGGGRPMSMGERFVNSDAYQQMLASYGGRIPEGTRVQMGAVDVGSIVNAVLEDPAFTPALHRIAPASLSIVDLFAAITVIDNAPQLVKTFTATFTNVAADVAESAAKPEATLVYADVDLVLKTIAQHIPVTNQALGHNPTLRNRIDVHLVNGIRARMQAKVATVLSGASGIQTQAFSTDLRTTIRRAITKAQNAAAQLGAGMPSILISANDAETLDLEALAVATTMMEGTGPAQTERLWRTPLIVSPSIADGFAYVGDLKQVELYVGGPITVTTGWIDDQFIKNQLTLLAETEAEAGVLTAPALVKADLTA